MSVQLLELGKINLKDAIRLGDLGRSQAVQNVTDDCAVVVRLARSMRGTVVWNLV